MDNLKASPSSGAHPVEVEDEVELANVGEEVVQDLYKEVDRFKHRQFVVCHIHADGEVQARIASIDDFVGAEL